MRKIFMIFSIATVFAACNTKSKTDLETNKDVVPTDTTGAFKNSLSTDTATATIAQPTVPAPTRTAPPPVNRTVTHVATRRQTPPREVTTPAPVTESKTVTAPVTTSTTTSSAPANQGSASNN